MEGPLDVLLGRSAEIEALAELCGRQQGELKAVAVMGPAGIGKTALWRAGVRMGSQAKVVVMSARPSSAEVPLAFSGLTDLFSEVGPPCMEALPPVQRHALDVALLRHEAVPAVDARTVSTAVLSALRHLASETPLLIAIDDVQWLDGASAGCLRFALRRLEASPVTLLVTLAAGANPTGTVLGAVARDRQVVIDLGPLDEPTTKELLKRGYAGRLPPREVAQVASASGGNPLYAIEIAREVLRVGHGHGALPLPSGLRELMNARFARLPASTREALVEMACMASARAGIIDPVPLARAEAAGLVATEGDGRVRFTHPLLAACIYDAVPLARRRAVHRRLSGRVDDPEERARHLALASEGANSEVAAQLDAAAKAAAARGAPQVAAELVELALELTPREDARARSERLLAAAGAHFEAGEVSRADELIEEELKATGTGHLRAAALRLAAQVKSRTASFDDSVQLACEALTVEGGGLALITSVHLDLVFYLTSLGDFGGALPHAEVALDNAASLGLDALEAQALAVRTVIRFLGGQGVCEADLARALALEVSDHPCPVIMRPTMIASLLMLWSGRPDEAKQSLDKQRLEAIERGAEPDGALLVLYVVWAQVWKGDIGGAVSTAAEALRAAVAAEDKIALALAYSADALASAYCGDEVRARTDAEQAAHLFSAMGWRSGAIWSSWALGLLELSLGDNQAVDAVLGPMASVVGNMTGADPVLAVFVPDQAEALIRLGEYARAEALVDAFERKAGELGRTWALAGAARCRGLLAGARGDLEGGAQCLAQALVLHDAAGLPFETARSLLELGCLLRRQKQRRLARVKLEQAHDAFTEMGAPLWAGRCEVELARVARPSHPSGLTATEETIAKLAADGLTNRAIAARSFVTVKTVEANLARAYRKLGISSRAQLARALDKGRSLQS